MTNRRLQHLVSGNAELDRVKEEGFKEITEAVAELLIPLGLQYYEAEHLLRVAFIEAARNILVETGFRPTANRVAFRIGLNRSRVGELIRLMERSDSNGLERSGNLIAVVLQAWFDNEKYQDEDGNPRPLSKSGPGLSFEDLASDTVKDIYPATVLSELIHAECVCKLDDKYVPIKRQYIPQNTNYHAVEVGVQTITDVVKTNDYNINKTTQDSARLFNRRAIADVPASQVADLMAEIHNSSSEFLTIINEKIELACADQLGDEPTVRMGLGMYAISDEESTPK